MVTTLHLSASDSRTICQAPETGSDEFVAVGIDDLAKYRIVQLLCNKLDACWEAAAYAERLGLRPVQRTIAELDELVERHILERRGAGGRARYTLTTDNGLRRELVRLFALDQAPLHQGRILARLASRSLERIRAQKRGRKKFCLYHHRVGES